MKSRLVIIATVIASLAPLSSFAQGRHDNQGRNDDRGDRNQQGPGRHQERNPSHGRDFERSNDRHGAYAYGARGPEWRRGGRVPYEYRGRQYVVNDWRGHHLHAPPRGQQWVQVGADYALVAVATGIIVQVLLR